MRLDSGDASQGVRFEGMFVEMRVHGRCVLWGCVFKGMFFSGDAQEEMRFVGTRFEGDASSGDAF